MRQIRRAFIAKGRPMTMSELVRWVYPELSKFKHWHRWNCRRALLRCAIPLGRSSKGIGCPGIWAPRRDMTQHGSINAR
jgi:hypothetical protein